MTVTLPTISSCATSSKNMAPTLSWMMNSSENTSAYSPTALHNGLSESG